MDDAFKIFIEQLRDGRTEKIDEQYIWHFSIFMRKSWHWKSLSLLREKPIWLKMI